MISPDLEHSYEFAGFRFETHTYHLLHDETVIALPLKAAMLLSLFLENQGKVFKKCELLDTLWPDEIVEEANLSQTIYLLRKAFSQSDPSQKFIETLPRVGYRFVALVQAAPPPATALPVVAAGPLRWQNTEQSLLTEQWEPVTDAPGLVHETEPPALTDETDAPTSGPGAVAPPDAMRRPVTSETGESLSFRETAGCFLLWHTRLGAKLRISPIGPGWYKWLSGVAGIFVVMFMCGFYVVNLHTSAKRLTVKSIAVLPFTGLDGAGPDRLLGLGMADTVTSKLGGLPGIEVRSPVAIRRYIDTPPEPLDAGRGLQVEAVLTGNIQHQQQTIRITAQLLRVSDGQTLWGETLDGEETELFMLQDRLAEHLAKALGLP